MSDNVELHQKLLAFLAGEFARKDERQCVRVDLDFAPGNGYKDESIRKWVRADEPDTFDNFANVEKLVGQVIEIAEGEANAKPPGKHRFVLRTHQHLGGRAVMSFALSPQFSGGSDELALAASPGGGAGGNVYRQDIVAAHAGQLMRINQQMFDGTMRYVAQQNMALHEEVGTLRAENLTLRRENDELKSTRMDREFQYAMAAEKNARSNMAFQKVLQIGTVVAAKFAGGGEQQAGGTPSPVGMLVAEFGKSLRPDQIGVLMNTLDMAQKIMFMELMNMVKSAEEDAGQGSGNAPPSGTPGSSTPS